ncbi:MAG: DUF3795 domain-containing protein [Promethearchaeota archaeon]
MHGYCGYHCHLCAARSDDKETRQKLVDGWRKYFGHQNYTAENVRCDGCKADGRLADKECPARPCAKAKGIEYCMLCDEFACDKVKRLMGSRNGMLCYHMPRTAPVTEDEYNLCMRQFDNMPFIIKILMEHGKVPAWWHKSE